MKKTNAHAILTSDRDIHILIYLWKWKLVTTNMIHHNFFEGRSKKTTYGRLHKLRSYGYIKTFRNETFAAWKLSKSGFETVKSCLPDLKEKGYLSEYPKHDLLCAMLHQGSLKYRSHKGIEIVTEQQLRRYEDYSLPEWVPDPLIHRPDGYWLFNEKKITALEVETSTKSNARIRSTLSYYNSRPNIHRVLWILPTRSYAKKILQYDREKPCHKGPKHNIVPLGQSTKNLWNSKILFGPDKNMTVHDFIVKSAQRNPKEASKDSSTDFLLDIAINPQDNTVSKMKLNYVFSD